MPTASGRRAARAPARRSLDPESIIATALEVIDAHGVDGLSMRNLGHALGVDAMTIYGYFDNKADLLAAIVGQEASRMQRFPEPLPPDPTDLIVHFALHYREVLIEHPNLAPLVIARPLSVEQAAGTTVLGLTILRAVGIPEAHLVVAAGALLRFTLGFVLHEALQSGSLYQLGIDREAHQAAVLDELRAHGASPTELDAAARQNRADAAVEELDSGLRAMIAGFAQPQVTRDGSG